MYINIFLRISIFLYIIVKVSAAGDQMLGKGMWRVLNVMKCDDDERYQYKYDVVRTKLNRTHDGFNAKITFEGSVDEDAFGIRIDICKYVDGGCKPYQVMADDSFCRFINKYAQNNVEKAFAMAGVDPPNCPLPSGEYDIKHYIFDYSELPEDGIFGMFGAKAYMLKDNEEMGCVDVTLEFKENDHDDDDSEEEK